MSNQRPNTFQLLQNIDGSEEVYTQNNGISEKFTVDQVKTYILQNVDVWEYKEVILTPSDLAQISTVKFQLLDENDLGSDEYYEIGRIIFESIINPLNNLPNSTVSPVYLVYKQNPTIPFTNPFPDNSILVDLPSGLIGCSLPMVYTYYMNKSFREFLPNTGLYLDSTANGGGGTVQYKIKIYYKRRLISL
jgi:hypothetical protein